MSEDAPTTNDIIHWLCGPANAGGLWNDALEEKFHSWLAEHDRQVSERAWDEGVNASVAAIAESHGTISYIAPHNPYRKERDDDCY